MAKILKKIPKRLHGKYADTGKIADDILLKNYNINDIFDEEIRQDLSDLSDADKQELLETADELADNLNFFSCITVSYKNLNGLNVFENAEKKGLTQNLNEKQLKILKQISNDTSFARILFLSAKYSGYGLIVLALSNFYIYEHYKILYNLMQPWEIYVFLGILGFIILSFLGQNVLANSASHKIDKMIKSKTR